MSPTRARAQATPGSNQLGVREFNERLVLQILRQHPDGFAKAELARLTRLSAQTLTLIVDRLIGENLLRKRAPVRGRVGQPSVPVVLNPDGAFSLGISVGRASLDVLLMDFTGTVRERSTLAYDFPDPKTVLREIDVQLKKGKRTNIVGVGIAAPFGIGGWHEQLGMPIARARAWDGFDLRAEVQRRTIAPVELFKDTSAACLAELVAGHGREVHNYLYLFIATFIGGGLVLGGRLHLGERGNAGAVASLPLARVQADARGYGSAPHQLLNCASLHALDRAFRAAKLDASARLDARALDAPWRAHTLHWLDDAANAIALACVNATALMDIQSVIVDGVIDRTVLNELVTRSNRAILRYNLEGIAAPNAMAGKVGADARAIGGALAPLYARFAPDQNVLLKAA